MPIAVDSGELEGEKFELKDEPYNITKNGNIYMISNGVIIFMGKDPTSEKPKINILVILMIIAFVSVLLLLILMGFGFFFLLCKNRLKPAKQNANSGQVVVAYENAKDVKVEENNEF